MNNRKLSVIFVATMLCAGAIVIGGSISPFDPGEDQSDTTLGSGDIDLLNAVRFGGSAADQFESVTATSDGGFVAVGLSVGFDSGDWAGVTGWGNNDAIIVKFDSNGTVVWKTRFGGSGADMFSSVTTTLDGGFVAVGYSVAASFGNGDWGGVTGRGGTDAIIVKFDSNGTVVWKNLFGGSAADQFNSVTTTSDGGFVAVGYSVAASFGNGDWVGVTGWENNNAIIVKFDSAGNVVWKNRFGGNGAHDYFHSVTTSDSGFVAVGYSNAASFGTGDWAGVTGRGNNDAIIVKFDSSGEVVWKNRFGGSVADRFNSVTSTSDGGFVAVGYSASASFGNGDWVGVTGRGGNDAIIVKFDSAGNVVWKTRFGGSGADQFNSVTSTSDGGFMAVGDSGGFGNGDWVGVTGRGGNDAIIVKFDSAGNALGRNLFGGSVNDTFNGVVVTSNDIFVAVGYSQPASFGNGDWAGVTGRGGNDAIIVYFSTVSEPQISIFSTPSLSIVTGNIWSYTPQTDPSGTTISVTGASWLSSNGTTISGTAPAPLDGISQTYDLTISASKAGFETATQSVSLTVYASLTFVSIPTQSINVTGG